MHADTNDASRASDARTVLVVDDNPALVALLHTVLAAEGYRVVLALARDAMRCAREWRPAVILLDIRMPELDGVQVCALLRADPDTAAIPVIALSAGLNLQLTGGAMQADAYMAKPFDVPALVETVAAWAGRESAHDAADAPHPPLRRAPAPARSALRERIAATSGALDRP